MAYFDNAATTYPKPEVVYTSMDKFYRLNGANAGRGRYNLAQSANALIGETRVLVQELLHCPAKQVVFTPTATIALNIIIQGLICKGAKAIYISPFEHNAVSRTLHHFEEAGTISVHQLTVSQDFKYDLDRMRYQFESECPDLVIMSHASNVLGLIAPVTEICSLAKKFGATTVIDMAQTAGLVDCNLGLNVFDFAVFAGHKTLYGPTGISGFIMEPAIDLPPVLFGGTGFESANQNMPQSLPERYEMGTMNISGIAGLNAALKWGLDQGIETIWQKEQEHRNKLIALLQEYWFIMDMSDAYSLSVSEVDQLSEALEIRGIIIYETAPIGKDVDHFEDYSRIDYEAIFEEIISLSPDLEYVVELIRKLPPPQYGEITALTMQTAAGNAYARERLILIHLRVALKIALSMAKSHQYDITKTKGKGKIKEFIRKRPNDETIHQFEELCGAFWNALIERFEDIYTYAAAEPNAQPYRNRAGGNLLFRPVALLPFVRAAVKVSIQQKKDFDEIFGDFPQELLYIDNIIWRNTLWNSDKGTMIVNNQKLTERILLYYWDRSTLTAKEISTMKLEIKSNLQLADMEDVETLLADAIDK